ncbi:MAG: TIGR00266 family protein [Myxococcales bacterium]|nr:TIGR00266 family protein [Myxococcales bacterium]MDD9971033.1 TIGR00266 family protein [Myxococcales bacterium]
MQIDILARPAAAAASIRLADSESITCEVGAMIAMSSGLHVETTTRNRGGGGGILKGIKRMFAGESLFLNRFTAQADGQQLVIGPRMMGDVVQHHIARGALIVQGQSWLASADGIDIDATFQGLGKALFSGESAFWVKCSGQGEVLLSSFGAIYALDIDDDYVVDTGHIVAFEDTLQFSIGKASQSLIGSFLGGEGLVCKFRGQGRLYCQSHNPPSFGNMIGRHLRAR